jgi:hypothetical protein
VCESDFRALGSGKIVAEGNGIREPDIAFHTEMAATIQHARIEGCKANGQEG